MKHQEVRRLLDAHDARVKDGNIEIRMLGSNDENGEGEFVIFIIINNGCIIKMYSQDEEDVAITHFLKLCLNRTKEEG